MEGALNNGMCRCCASEGTFKDVSSKYQWMGEDEIYADMLRECFDITLTNAEEGQDGGICEVCITQLRNAANFKKQVLATEEQFKKGLQDHMFKNDIIKVEVNALDDDGNTSDNHLSDDYSGPEYEVPIKQELDDAKGKKRSKATTSRAKKAKLDGGDSSKSNRWGSSHVAVSKILKLLNAKPPKKEPNDWSVSIKGRDQKNFVGTPLTSSTRRARLTLNCVATKVMPPPKIKQLKLGSVKGALPSQIIKKQNLVFGSSLKKESGRTPVFVRLVDKHLHNARQILLCTNATPIKSFDGIAYSCGYCNDRRPTAAELKKHSLEEHGDGDKKTFSRTESLTSLLIKLDITDFKCILCDGSLDNLEDAIKHLQTVHDKIYIVDIDNHILTFKFNSEGVICAVCLRSYVSFKLALEHMRVHYSNYVCDICNTPFVNKRNLQSHQNRHKQGDFACSFCEKIFGTLTKRNDHEKFVHKNQEYKRNKCSHCGEKFISYKKKLDHEVEVHGRQPLRLKCMACDLVFNSRNSLTKHTRRDHLMERSHACQECDKRFFTSKCLKNHMLTHTGVRKFKCDVCFKAYGRKTTLKEHLRIHADDRRFKCDFCGAAFVQKCSLKGHMRSKHSEILDYHCIF